MKYVVKAILLVVCIALFLVAFGLMGVPASIPAWRVVLASFCFPVAYVLVIEISK